MYKRTTAKICCIQISMLRVQTATLFVKHWLIRPILFRHAHNRQISTWLCRRALLHFTTRYMQFPYFQSKLERNNSGHTISDWQRRFDNKKETTEIANCRWERWLLHLSSVFMPYTHFRDREEKRHKIKKFPFSLPSSFYLALSWLSTFYIPCFLLSR